MDQNLICSYAGIVWKLVNSRKQACWSYRELKTATGLSDEELSAAIEWLIRGKLIEADPDLPAEQ